MIRLWDKYYRAAELFAIPVAIAVAGWMLAVFIFHRAAAIPVYTRLRVPLVFDE